MKKIPFGLSRNKEAIFRDKESSLKETTLLEYKLEEYSEGLVGFKHCLGEYTRMLEEYKTLLSDTQDKLMNQAIDVTQLKEQGNRSIDLLESIAAGGSSMSKVNADLEGLILAVAGLGDNLKGMDKNMINRLTELLVELQKQSMFQSKQLQSEQVAELEDVKKKVQKGNRFQWLLFIVILINLAAVTFMLLKDFGIITF